MRPGSLRILLAVLLLGFVVPALLPAPATAQTLDWNRLDDPLFEGIGMHLGLSGGFGLSYKFPVKWWLYVQASGGIWNTRDDDRHNVGVELQYVLRQSGRDRLFLGASAAHFYHKHSGRTMDHFNTGFGVGLERLLGERTALEFEATFTDRGDRDSVMLFPQIGLHYYF